MDDFQTLCFCIFQTFCLFLQSLKIENSSSPADFAVIYTQKAKGLLTSLIPLLKMEFHYSPCRFLKEGCDVPVLMVVLLLTDEYWKNPLNQTDAGIVLQKSNCVFRIRRVGSNTDGTSSRLVKEKLFHYFWKSFLSSFKIT